MSEIDFIQDGIPHVILSNCYYEKKLIKKAVLAGTPIALPKKGTYQEGKLVVCVNNQSLRHLIDFNYDTAETHTKVWLTFDLHEGDVITFRTTE